MNQRRTRVTARQLIQIAKLGVKSLLLHRLRSILTTLGMVFGVCSVIAMLAIGEGANYEAQEQIRQLGSQNVILKSVKPAKDENQTLRRGSTISTYGLTYDDVTTIQETIPGISVIVPDRRRRGFAHNGHERAEVEVIGAVPWFLSLQNQTMTRGRFINDRDLATQAKVCILEKKLADRLFPLTLPLGNTARVGRHYFEVIGILNTSLDNAPASTAANEAPVPPKMIIPLSTARALFGEMSVRQYGDEFEAERVALHEVTIKVEKLEHVAAIANIVRSLLARVHDKQDFEVIVPLELMDQARRTKRIFNTVLGSIAAISLLVGGIGIMNIMLASVSERTKEIGIRRAVGAKRADIVTQFLTETILLSSIGGILGVIVGVAIPQIVGLMSGMKTVVTWWSPLLAFSISTLTGVVFGLYPAMQAADMDPVVAVRHD